MTLLRFKMVEEAINRKAPEVKFPGAPASEYFGMYVFNREKMAEYLPEEVFREVINAIDKGKSLSQIGRAHV